MGLNILEKNLQHLGIQTKKKKKGGKVTCLLFYKVREIGFLIENDIKSS